MPTVISIEEDFAVEKSHMGIVAAFKDENGDAVVPDSIQWTLTDENGTIVNGRQDESITPASSAMIVLKGDDLQILTEETSNNAVWRILTIDAQISSDLGTNLPLTDSIRFAVKNLKAVI